MVATEKRTLRETVGDFMVIASIAIGFPLLMVFLGKWESMSNDAKYVGGAILLVSVLGALGVGFTLSYGKRGFWSFLAWCTGLVVLMAMFYGVLQLTRF